MKIPHPIPYQGSKRGLAKYILPFFPLDIQTLFEPPSPMHAVDFLQHKNSQNAKYIEYAPELSQHKYLWVLLARKKLLADLTQRACAW